MKLARKLKTNESREWAAWVTGGQDKWIPGRLIIVRRSKQAAALALKKLKRRGVRKQITVSVTSLEATKYFFMWTTMPSSWSCQTILDLYRSRWQIELAFKRMKSIMGLGHLPKKDPESCRAWLHGKLFTSLLVELMIGTAKDFPLGLRIGYGAGVDGVKPSTCSGSFAQPFFPHRGWQRRLPIGPRSQRDLSRPNGVLVKVAV